MINEQITKRFIRLQFLERSGEIGPFSGPIFAEVLDDSRMFLSRMVAKGLSGWGPYSTVGGGVLPDGIFAVCPIPIGLQLLYEEGLGFPIRRGPGVSYTKRAWGFLYEEGLGATAQSHEVDA